VLEALAHPEPISTHVARAAMLLRGAADDLVAVVELLQGASASEPSSTGDPTPIAFELAFRHQSGPSG
jgi:hypothetical protein